MADDEPPPVPRKRGHLASRGKHPARSARIPRPVGLRVPDLSTPHNQMVTIIVGGGEVKERFIVHKSFITYYSPFFKDAFTRVNDLFVEQDVSTMTFSDTTPAVFGIFVRWVYSKTIKDDNKKLPSTPAMVRLWVLGDKILCSKLQNAAIRGLYEERLFGCAGSLPEIAYVYRESKVGSPLRQLLIDQMTRKVSYESLADAMVRLQELPREMMADLLLAQKALLTRSTVAAKMVPVTNYLINDVQDD